METGGPIIIRGWLRLVLRGSQSFSGPCGSGSGGHLTALRSPSAHRSSITTWTDTTSLELALLQIIQTSHCPTVFSLRDDLSSRSPSEQLPPQWCLSPSLAPATLLRFSTVRLDPFFFTPAASPEKLCDTRKCRNVDYSLHLVAAAASSDQSRRFSAPLEPNGGPSLPPPPPSVRGLRPLPQFWVGGCRNFQSKSGP